MCCVQVANAQTDDVEMSEGVKQSDVVYSLKQEPTCIDNYLSGFFYANGGTVFTMRNYPTVKTSNVTSLKLSPSGATYAFINEVKGKKAVNVYDLWRPKKQYATLSFEGFVPTALCYSADARHLYVCSSDGTLYAFETSKYAQAFTMNTTIAGNKLTASPNGFFVAASAGTEVEVINVDGRTIRTRLTMSSEVKDVEFSNNSQYMAVLTSDGKCTIYDTASFSVAFNYNSMGTAESCFFHPENKYIAVVTGDQRLAIINMLNDKDRNYVLSLIHI